MARIDPSRQGDMDEPQDTFGVCRKNEYIEKVKNTKILEIHPSLLSAYAGPYVYTVTFLI